MSKPLWQSMAELPHYDAEAVSSGSRNGEPVIGGIVCPLIGGSILTIPMERHTARTIESLLALHVLEPSEVAKKSDETE